MGDLVLADRGFIIKDLLNKKRADLIIPPFLSGRSRLTSQEEMETKINANAHRPIHVERAIERLKNNTHYLVKLSHCHSVLFFIYICFMYAVQFIIIKNIPR